MDRVLEKPGDVDTPLALRCWLDEATAGLPAPTRARVEAEVTAHFEELRSAALMRGLPEIDALFETLNTLGSAKRARKGFHRAYWTVQDEEMLARWLTSVDQFYGWRWYMRLVFSVTIFVAFLVCFLLDVMMPILSGPIVVMAAFITIFGLGMTAMSNSLRQRKFRRAWFWIYSIVGIINTAAIGVFMSLLVLVGENASGTWTTWLAAGFFFLLIPLLTLRNFGLLRKLPRVLSDEDVARLRVVAEQIESRKKPS